jgi:hypothetical protein
MENVAPLHTVARRSRALFEVAFILVTGGIFLGVLGLALYVIPFDEDANTLLVFSRGALLILGVVAGLAGIGFAIRAATIKPENTIAYQAGEYLRRHFDESYSFIRNINRRQVGYIDAVLVGKPGILVFRVLDSQGRFLNEKSNWMRADKRGQWRPLMNNPTKEVVEDIKALRQFFADKGLAELPVFGVIVFLKDDPTVHLTLQSPVVPATHLTSLYRRLGANYLAKERIDQRTVDKIVKILKDE